MILGLPIFRRARAVTSAHPGSYKQDASAEQRQAARLRSCGLFRRDGINPARRQIHEERVVVTNPGSPPTHPMRAPGSTSPTAIPTGPHPSRTGQVSGSSRAIPQGREDPRCGCRRRPSRRPRRHRIGRHHHAHRRPSGRHGHRRQAEPAYLQAVRLAESFRARFPENREAATQPAETCRLLGFSYQSRWSCCAQARPWLDRALAIYRETNNAQRIQLTQGVISTCH